MYAVFTSPTPVVAGLLWGVLIYAPHFHWFVDVMICHSSASWWLIGALYSVVVLYFSASSMVWFWIAARLDARCVVMRGLSAGWCRAMIMLLTGYGYWVFVESYSLLPINLAGYPFISPCIPLAYYKPFLAVMACMAAPSIARYSVPHSYAYISPVINKIKNVQAPWCNSPEGVGQMLYHALANISLEGQNKPVLLVAPESTFPFALNRHLDCIAQWNNVLPDKAHMLIGSVFAQGQQYYQSVFWLHGRLIIKIYVKKILTPFVEKVPATWRTISTIKEAFMGQTVEYSESSVGVGDEFFDVTTSLRVIPRICLEFFFLPRQSYVPFVATGKATWIFLFVNDSWFNNFFRTILYRLAAYKASCLGLPVLFIGHFGCWEIVP